MEDSRLESQQPKFSVGSENVDPQLNATVTDEELDWGSKRMSYNGIEIGSPRAMRPSDYYPL